MDEDSTAWRMLHGYFDYRYAFDWATTASAAAIAASMMILDYSSSGGRNSKIVTMLGLTGDVEDPEAGRTPAICVWPTNAVPSSTK